MNELIAFFVAAGLSFWGSLPLGIVNLQVIQTALFGNREHTNKLIIGGVLPELIYSFLAIHAVAYFSKQRWIEDLSILMVVAFIGLGIYYLVKQHQVPKLHKSASGSFLKGFVLALINPQLIIYWMAMLIFLKPFINLSDGTFFSPEWGFILGTAVGAYLALQMFASLTYRFKDRIAKWLGIKMDRVFGWVFITLGVFELVRWITTNF